MLQPQYASISPKIVRQGHLAEKIVIVDGQPGCGKTMLSPIIAALERVELLNYAFEIEFICRLYQLNKIAEDAAIALVRMFTDHKLYQTMMGRETNFRYNDISSVFKDSNPFRYFIRIFREGDRIIPERIKREKPILNLTTHDLLSVGEPVFAGLGNRVILIEVVRHPLYMIKQQEINIETLLTDPRDVQVYFEYAGKQLPYFAYEWEDLFISSNTMEKAIYTIDRQTQLTKESKKTLIRDYNAQIITIPFEKFVIEPWLYMKKIENLLETKRTSTTLKVMKKQKVPRRIIGDGLDLKAYRRCGWQPVGKESSEERELEIRRQFAAKKASPQSMDVLDELCRQYENNYLA